MAKKKLLGALPVGFKGKFAGVPFSISVQYDIYGNVSAIVLGDKNNTIVAIDGDKKKEKAFIDTFNGYIFKGSGYSVSDIETYNKNYFTKVKNFVKNINQEVNDYNKKQMPIKKAVKKVAKKVATKKAIVKKAIKKTAPKKAVKKTASKQAVKKQTGTSNIALDKLRKAKAPGKRTSKDGNVYYESRANRSDAGQFLGIGSVIKRFDPKSEIIQDLRSLINTISGYERNIFNLGLMIKNPQNKNIKISLKKDLSIYKSLLKERNIEYKELKKLL
jgi:hypothetical protein